MDLTNVDNGRLLGSVLAGRHPQHIACVINEAFTKPIFTSAISFNKTSTQTTIEVYCAYAYGHFHKTHQRPIIGTCIINAGHTYATRQHTSWKYINTIAKTSFLVHFYNHLFIEKIETSHWLRNSWFAYNIWFPFKDAFLESNPISCWSDLHHKYRYLNHAFLNDIDFRAFFQFRKSNV